MVLRGFLVASLSLIFFFFFYSSPPSFYYTTFLSLLLCRGRSIEPLFPFVTLVPSPLSAPPPLHYFELLLLKSINGSTGPRPWCAVDRNRCGVQSAVCDLEGEEQPGMRGSMSGIPCDMTIGDLRYVDVLDASVLMCCLGAWRRKSPWSVGSWCPILSIDPGPGWVISDGQ
jgi:hypothetical protein